MSRYVRITTNNIVEQIIVSSTPEQDEQLRLHLKDVMLQLSSIGMPGQEIEIRVSPELWCRLVPEHMLSAPFIAYCGIRISHRDKNG